MKGNSKLGLAAFAAVMVLSSGRLALAQVDWTYLDSAVPLGPPGSWDDTGHLVEDIVFDGATYHLYVLGGRTAEPWTSPWSIGHWTSTSLTGPWVEDLSGNPVLEPEPGQWDGYSIYSATVLYDGGTFRMWYGATGSYRGQLFAGYAESPDGSVWTKHGGNPLSGLEPGVSGTWNDWGVSPNAVIKDGATYQMWFTAFEYNLGAIDHWRIGHATSTDGLQWSMTPDPVFVGTEAWEGNIVYNAEVVRIGDGYGMWYTGATFSPALAYVGYAVSPDGIHWGKWPDNPVITPLPACNLFDSLAAIQVGDVFHGWGTSCFDVYHLTSPFDVVFFDAFESGDTTIWTSVVP